MTAILPSPAAEQKGVFNPFPGLRPFHSDEDHLFFGRERETDELLRRLRANRFVSVLGTSGSGKSSLVRSGLIPSLYSGYMVKAGSTWRVAILRPGDDPIGNLAHALDEPDMLGDDDPGLAGAGAILQETTLRRSTMGLVDCVRQARLPAYENLLVVVDQFEELFRFKGSRRVRDSRDSRDEAVAFSKLLLQAAAQHDSSIYIVITMRSDFIGDCMEYPGLPEAINQGQYLIPRMTRDELRSAITGPVAVGGGAIAPRLVARLLNDVGDDPDQLPVLQHALMRTWDRWAADHDSGEAMDLRHYEAIGNLSGALSRHADEAFEEIGVDRKREIAQRLFKLLTDTRLDNRGVRRPTPVSEVVASAGVGEAEVIEVVDVFRRPGRSFLMPPPGVSLTGDSILDLSHESLMRCWQRLAVWVEEESASGKSYRHLCRAARRYKHGQASLWVEPELSIGLKWREENRPTEAWARRYDPDFDQAMAFLDESRAANEKKLAAEEHERLAKLRRARFLAGVLGSAAGVTLIFGLYALYAGGVARQAERKALKEAQTASVVSGFLVDLFGVADPEEAQGNTITAREILDQGARNIDAQLAEQPEVRSRLMAAMGKVYGSLGLYDAAEPLLKRAADSARESLGADAPETLEAMDLLAKLQLDQGRFQQSKDLYTEVIEARRRVLGKDDPATLRSMTGLADLYREQEFHGEAEKIAREALDVQRRALGDEHEDTLRTKHVLGMALNSEGKYKEAESLLTDVLRIRRVKLGDEHPDTLASLDGLGTLYIDLGRYEAAEALYKENLENRRKIYGKEHPKTFEGIERLAELELEKGQYEKSEELRRQALDGRRRVQGENHPRTLQTMGLLAWTYRQQGRFEEALELAGKAYEAAKRALGEEHPKTLELANTLSSSYMSNGRNDLAEKIQARNLEIYQKLYGEAHPQTLTARNNLAAVYQRWGQREKAEEAYKKSVQIARDSLGEEHPLTLFMMANLIGAYNAQGRYKEAEDLALKVVEADKRVLGTDHPQTFAAQNMLGSVYRGLDRLDDTERLAREVLEGRRRVFGSDHSESQGSLANLAGLIQQRGRYEEAEKLILELQEIRRRVYGEESPQAIGTYGWLAWSYEQMGKSEKEIPLRKQVLSIRRKIAGQPDASAKDMMDYVQTLIWARPQLQNAKEAIRFAQQANEMTEWKNRDYVVALAEAYSRDGDNARAVETIEKALRLVPEDALRTKNQLESRMADFLEAAGDHGLLRELEMERLKRMKSLATEPGASPRAKDSYAWALLTAKFEDLRDPKEALPIALHVSEETGFQQAGVVTTLALAYHLNGQRSKAIETQKKVLSIDSPDDVWGYPVQQNRLRIYEGGRRDGVDLGATLPGIWSGKAGPLDMRIEFVKEGKYLNAIIRSELSWIPPGETSMRFNSGTGQLELHESDAGWTNLRWRAGDYLFTNKRELLIWDPRDYEPARFAKGDTPPR